MTLSPGKELIDITQPLEIVWNGMDKQSVSITEGKATLWAQGYTQSHWRKTPEREGPLSDVMNTPFAIVPGTISVVNDTQKLLQKDIMHGTQL